MALSYKLEGDILEVKQALMSFHKTEVSYWYYDIKRWLVSSFGKQGDRPDRVMRPEQIEWVRKHYLPHVRAHT